MGAGHCVTDGEKLKKWCVLMRCMTCATVPAGPQPVVFDSAAWKAVLHPMQHP